MNIKHRQGVEKKEEDLNWCVLQAGGLTSAGVYMSKEWTVQKYGQVTAHLGGYWRRGRKALVVGDWNAHHTLWGSATNDGKGKEIKEQMESTGGLWLGIRGEGTFRRTNGNQVLESTLDMAWQGPEDNWQMTEWFWTGSDHKAISFQTSTKETGPLERKVIDWLGLKLAVEEGDWTLEVRKAWWRSTPGKMAYDKLLTWVYKFTITQTISGRTKKWWDEEVARQAKVVRHEGQGGHNRANASNYERVMRWKLEAAKLKKMIKKKKKECWERFMEEHREEDP